MMDALGVARDLGADDARRVALLFGAAHAPDALAVDHLDVERADRRAIVRADRRPPDDLGGRVGDRELHRRSLAEPADGDKPRTRRLNSAPAAARLSGRAVAGAGWPWPS